MEEKRRDEKWELCVVCECEEEQESEWQTSSPLLERVRERTNCENEENLKKIKIKINEIHKIFEMEMFIEMQRGRRLQKYEKEIKKFTKKKDRHVDVSK